jgi:geranyl-CoA carboxylase alpha subunit
MAWHAQRAQAIAPMETMLFNKILIANRGEIACRIIRSAQYMGYQTVAVFSDADADALHVALADEAVHIGASPATQSYLNVPALLEAARTTGADAVHPGYGFLSENATFAQACADAGLVFIGPPAAAIEAMGNKALSKRRMQETGVPCAPGYLGADQSNAVLTAEAHALGFPLLVKAVAGGGGRGMRLVQSADELQAGIDGARREAQSAFGDATLMIERLISSGRHIEIQVFADAHGNVVHLGERDCTAQRRRQKVIEESPSPVMTPALREAMGRDAVAAARAVGYQGAGTVEFMVDASLKHYFLEMNTRLQVEHPVTEMVTGLDLVEWQLRVAAGEPLPLQQDQIRFSGHAIEVRLYAEDPYHGFAPQSGNVLWWQPERAIRAGIRVDDGIRQGSVVSPFYDSMLAKFIAHGRDRDDAIRRLRAALAQAPLLGLRNNAGFLRDLLDNVAFRKSILTTESLDRWQAQGDILFAPPAVGDDVWALAAAALVWSEDVGWRPDSVAAYGLRLQCEDRVCELRVRADEQGTVTVWLDAAQAEILILSWTDSVLRYRCAGVQRSAVAVRNCGTLYLALDGVSQAFREVSAFPSADAVQDASRALAPVAGTVSHVLVSAGQTVQVGQRLLCVEAMKMEMWLCAQSAGIVRAVHVSVCEQVKSAALLVELDLTNFDMTKE